MFERLIFYSLLSYSVRDSGCLSFCIYLPFVTFRKLPLPWGNEDTARILDILKEHDVKATFFMTGEWVEKYPQDVLAIKEAGHDLANHSETHRSMTGLEKGEQRQEVLSVHEKVLELAGVEMRLFRAPYDNYDDDVIRNIEACGYYPIQWSVDTGGTE